MVEADEWTCPACHKPLDTPYCPACGESRLHPRDLTLRGLLHQALEAFTSLDARLPRSIRELVRHPGNLTVRYVAGPRKPYVGPFALFLLANLLFVAMESVTGSNAFSTPLQKHLHNQPWGDLATQLVSHRLESTGRTLDAYMPVFDRAVSAHAKSLVILMVLPFALLPAMLFKRTSRPFAAHLAFSLHFHAFMLLFISVALVFVGIDLLFGGAGIESQRLDDGLSMALLVGCAVYLHLATGPVYGTRGVLRILQTAALLSAAVIVFLGYRFVLLLITLYST